MNTPAPNPKDTSPSTGRVAVIGDIGGHVDELYAALVAVGASPATLELPDDLTVIQVGDLIDRGPASTAVLRMVDRMLTTQPDRWVQLIGNHEANHLGPRQLAHTDIDTDDVAVLRRWHDAGHLTAAVVIDTADGPLLVTHAGVGPAFWNSRGRLVDATDQADDINILFTQRRWGELAAPGRMLADATRGTRHPNRRTQPPPGPLWAEAAFEVHGAWLTFDAAMPFDQVHGHSVPYRYHSNTWAAPEVVIDHSNVDTHNRWVTTHVADRRIVACDPELGRYGGVRWRPWVTDGSVRR